MDSMGLRTRPGRSGESGFTLAGVIVIMTIMMIVVAYTVPRMWSTVMKREREKETIYAMQQYAKAIVEFREKNKAFPTSIQQLKDARQPRMIRGVKGEFTDPLTREVDWLVIPQAAGASLPAHFTTTNGSPLARRRHHHLPAAPLVTALRIPTRRPAFPASRSRTTQAVHSSASAPPPTASRSSRSSAPTRMRRGSTPRSITTRRRPRAFRQPTPFSLAAPRAYAQPECPGAT